MASIRARKRADGTTAYQVAWRDGETGKRDSFTAATREEAETLKRLLNANGQSFRQANEVHAAALSTTPTVNQIVEDWLGQLSKIESGTRAKYERMWRLHIHDTIGGVKTEFLDRRTVINWFEGLSRAPKTKKNIHAVLSSALSWAVDQQVLDWNPARGIGTPKSETRSTRPVFLTRPEVDRVQARVAASNPRYGLLVEFLAGTGLRWSEATALTRSDFTQHDTTGHLQVMVTKAWKKTAHGVRVGGPKTAASRRTVTLSLPLTARMWAHIKHLPWDGLVFPNESGGRLTGGQFYNNFWKPTLDELGADPVAPLMKRPRVHDLRHSHASWLIAAGVPLPVIQARLGHESIQTTVDIYGHLGGDEDLQAADAVA